MSEIKPVEARDLIKAIYDLPITTIFTPTEIPWVSTTQRLIDVDEVAKILEILNPLQTKSTKDKE